MKKVIRLTESDLVRLVSRIIREQQEDDIQMGGTQIEKELKNRIQKTFGISDLCSISRTKTFPYNEDVKKLQEFYIKHKYEFYPDFVHGEQLKADGILGPKTLSVLCPG
jgi:hypothetical protein